MIRGRNVGARCFLSQVPAFLQYVSNLRLGLRCLPYKRPEQARTQPCMHDSTLVVFHFGDMNALVFLIEKPTHFIPPTTSIFPVTRAHVNAKFKLDFTLLFFQMLSIVLRRSKKCLSPTSSEQSESQKTQSKLLGPRYRYEVIKSSPSSIHCSRPVQTSVHVLGKSFVVIYLYFLCSTVFSSLLRFWMSF